jgi:hypothetical protein
VRVHLGQLVELEYVVIAAGRNGKRLTYELLFDGDPEEDRRFLAGLVDVETTGRPASKGNGRIAHASVPLVAGPAIL